MVTKSTTTMSKILIPVDFSLASHNAYRYGLHLANSMGLDVLLAHYYTGTIDTNNPLVITGDGSIQGSYERRLRSFAYSSADGVDYPLVQPPRGVEIAYDVQVSLTPSAAINRRAAQDDITLLVMPPRSSRAPLAKWLGSTSTTVSESCIKPVYLVPTGVAYTPFSQIVVANNHAVAESLPLEQISKLATTHDSLVHFVHVEWPRQHGPLQFTPWRLMEQLVEKQPADYSFEVVTVEEKDITKGLMDYAEGVSADLVIVVNNTRKRWRAFLQATLTQDLALRADRPMLVLHTENHAEQGDKPAKNGFAAIL